MKFLIKFYNKTTEYFKQYKGYECQLYEPLAPEERKLVGEAYDNEKNTLNLEMLGITKT